MRAVRRTLLMLFAGATGAAAQPAVTRLGTHAGYGRVVFEFPTAPTYTSERDGNTVVLHFPGGGDVPAADGKARNVSAVAGGAEMATVTVAPGARLHITQLGTRVVMDVLDAAAGQRADPQPAPPRVVAGAAGPAALTEEAAQPAPVQPAAAKPATLKSAAAKPATPKPGAVKPASVQPASVQAVPPKPAPAEPSPVSPATQEGRAPPEAPPHTEAAAPSPAVAAPASNPVASPAAASAASPAAASAASPAAASASVAAASPPPETLAIAASRAPSAAGPGEGSALSVPFGAGVAAAAFQHGDETWIVFDERRPIDLASLAGDPVFASARVELLPSATLVRVKLPPARALRLDRRAEGWSIRVGSAAGSSAAPAGAQAAAQAAAIMPVARPPRLLLAVTSPGQVVAVPDAETGRNLLVGTLKAYGPGVPVTIRTPEFAILPSWQGVVIEPVSDRTDLRAVPEGFALETGSVLSALPDSARALAKAVGLTRRFDFPADKTSALLRRLQTQVQEVGQTPVQARLEPRKAVAQTMLALGLGAEAQSLLQLAAAEDPRAAADPEVSGLAAIAALLCGRPREADGLDAPGLAGTDEIALWRAVRAAMANEDAAGAAHVFASTAGLVSAYPSALRNRLLPLAAETMALGGAPEAADAMLASLPDEPLLAYARAIRLQQKGETASALTVYDALANGRDRLASARAATAGTLLRLSSGAISPADAAKALERGFESWRGDARERDLRLRAAEVEAQAGQWHKAIETLKETAELFPTDAASITGRIPPMIGDLLHGPGAAAIAPLDLVALAEENAASIAQADRDGMSALLSEKLIALDLPKRAGPIIETMAAAAPPGAGRAALGAQLAALRLGEGDAPGAAAALASTDAPALPPALQEKRGLLDARIHTASHDTVGAVSILSGIGTQAADELRATILGDSGDWHGAAAALNSLAARTLPESGPLDDAQQDLVLRLASAQSRAADEPALHALGLKQGPRMSGPRGDMFRLLTAAPVTGVRDLHRVSTDIALARALPGALNTIGAR